ncbi:MAG TPA: oxygenase MpaB family protein [Acidimicrobiales bacterium]|nr:oxygenase MpaB family protein [Acidimicrobiales bacterium]
MPRTAVLLAGRSLLLQVMHPVVGAAVADHSDFRADPWGRFERTVASLQRQLFGGERSVAEAHRLRALHRTITGTGFDGTRYSALDRGAYAWVHLSNFDTFLCFSETMGTPLTPAERARAYAEWRQLGRVLGIAEAAMPGDLAAFARYVERMVSDVLVDNPTARDVLAALELHDVAPPPWAHVPAPLWKAARPLGRSVLRDCTLGTLPPAARAALGLRWSALDRQRFLALALLVRAGSAAVPDRVLQYPEGRRAQLAARRASTG